VCSQRDRLALEANLAEEEKAAATHRAHTLNTLLSRDRTEVRAPQLSRLRLEGLRGFQAVMLGILEPWSPFLRPLVVKVVSV